MLEEDSPHSPQSEVIRAIMLEEDSPHLPQSEMIRAIMLEDSPHLTLNQLHHAARAELTRARASEDAAKRQWQAKERQWKVGARSMFDRQAAQGVPNSAADLWYF